MATLNTSIYVNQKTVDIDSKYGPYNSKADVISALTAPGSASGGNIAATNGLTVGIWEGTTQEGDRRVVEYVFQGIGEGETPTATNLVRKVSTITISQNGQETTYYLDKGDNVTIAITGETQVQANWNETNTNAKSYIQNKPTIPAAQVNSDWNSESGVSQILNKPDLSHVVYYEDVPAS